MGKKKNLKKLFFEEVSPRTAPSQSKRKLIIRKQVDSLVRPSVAESNYKQTLPKVHCLPGRPFYGRYIPSCDSFWESVSILALQHWGRGLRTPWMACRAPDDLGICKLRSVVYWIAELHTPRSRIYRTQLNRKIKIEHKAWGRLACAPGSRGVIPERGEETHCQLPLPWSCSGLKNI
jgi:hypothetical protein